MPTISSKTVRNSSYLSSGIVAPDATACRVVPVGSTTAKLLGANTPPFFSASLTTYTLQLWLNFDAVAQATSWGVDPLIFKCDDGTDGIQVYLAGLTGPGAHSWTFYVFHRNGGSSSGVAIPGYVFDTPNPGWTIG